MNITRRSLVAAGIAGAGFGGISVPRTLGQAVSYTRYNATSPQGQLMLSKLARAIGIMKGSRYPIYDPHSFIFQWFTHWTDRYQAVSYEDSTAYKAALIAAFPPGAPKEPAEAMWNTCQAHSFNPQNPNQWAEWFFLPWHRMYLYYFEQIVRNVLSDRYFSLPYWNNSSGNPADTVIPAAFRDQRSPLYDSTRFTPANAGTPIALLFNRSDWVSVNCLYEPFYIDSANGAFGFCPQADINPHFLIHEMIGGDMRDGFNTAAKDPVFWVHHANVDRLWESWNRLGGKNPADPSWLGRIFTFADGNGRLVNVPVRAVNRTAQLGYQYDSYAVPPGRPRFSEHELDKARAMPRVMAALGPRGVDLRAGATVVPLTPVAGADESATSLPRRIEALAPGRQIYLAFEGLRANAKPDVAYGLYLDLPEGVTPSGTSDPHFAGVLAFPAETVGDPAFCGGLHRPAYNITEVVRRMNADQALGATGNAITIVPMGTPSAHILPTIDQITMIEV